MPSGGLFIVPAMSNPLLFMVALLAGSVVTGILLVLTKRRLPRETAEPPDAREEDHPDAREEDRPGAREAADPLAARAAADREKDVDLGDISFS